MDKIDGQEIEDIETINSMYANGLLQIKIGNKWEYRLSVSTILEMVNEFNFKTTKKRKYIHLIEPILKE